MARTLALIAPSWPILHRVSCSSEMVPNAPKRKEMHRKMSLGSNGVDRECLLRKNLTRHCCTNFCINVQFGAFCTKFRVVAKLFQNAPEQKETHQNMSLGSNGVDRERSLRKNLTRHRCTNFCINCTSLAHFAPSFVQ